VLRVRQHDEADNAGQVGRFEPARRAPA
jgi:hypothetical protein